MEMTFNETIEAHYKTNFKALCLRMRRRLGGKMFLAEEAVQEAYAKAITYPKMLEGDDFEKWIWRIVCNCANEKRDEEYQKDFSEDEATYPQDTSSLDRRRIHLIIKNYNAKKDCKRVLELRFIHGMPLKDIPNFVDKSYAATRKTVEKFIKEVSGKAPM